MENVIFLSFAFLASVLGTIAGFGSSTILVPVAMLFMNAKMAIALVACFHLANNVFKLRFFSKKLSWKLFFMFGLPSVVFAWLGAEAVNRVDVTLIKQGVGVFLIAFVIFSFVKKPRHLQLNHMNACMGGACSGFLAGLIGLGGAIRSTFLVAFGLPKEVYIATGAAIALVVDLARIPVYVTHDLLRREAVYLLPLLILIAWLGVRTGKDLLDKLRQDQFRVIVLILLALVGIKLLVQ